MSKELVLLDVSCNREVIGQYSIAPHQPGPRFVSSRNPRGFKESLNPCFHRMCSIVRSPFKFNDARLVIPQVTAGIAATNSVRIFADSNRETMRNASANRAPLRNADLPSQAIIPDQYFVYLEPGYTLEDHKRTVGEAALPEDSIIQVRDLATDRYGLYCVAHLGESSLDTVRLDPGVQLVECSIGGWLDD